MKHLVLLTAIYALALPSSLMAQEEVPTTETTPAETVAPEPAPAEPAPAEPAPAEPAPAPAEPAPAEPEPQFLADERDEAPPAAPKALAAQSGGVTIVDFSFGPATITINEGDTVTWTNNGPTPHSATSTGGAFDTGIFPAGQSRSHTFNEAGTYSYICTPHPNMHGTVVVQAAQTETPDSNTGGTTDDTSGAGAAQTDDGPTLPDTGSDSGWLLLLGGLLLLVGWAVQRRTQSG